MWHRDMATERCILLLQARSTDGFDVQAQSLEAKSYCLWIYASYGWHRP